MTPVPRTMHRWPKPRRSLQVLIPAVTLAIGCAAVTPATGAPHARAADGQPADASSETPAPVLGLIGSVHDDAGTVITMQSALDGALDFGQDPPGGRFTAAGRIDPSADVTHLRTTGDVCLTLDGEESCDGEPVAARAGAIDLAGATGERAGIEWLVGDRWASVPLDALRARDLNADEVDTGRTVGVASPHCEPGDEDCDGIPGTWEVDGYTAERSGAPGGVGLVPWDPSKHDESTHTRFVSSPLKASTNGDPFTDFQKATGLQLDPRVSPEARHPLVAAAPDIEAVMTSFELIPNTSWSSETGGERSKSVTQTTDIRFDWSVTVGVGTDCGGSDAITGCKVSSNFSATVGGSVGYSESNTNSSTERWNSIISGNNAQSALLLPRVYYENTGTAPVVNAYPLFTISLGSKALMSASTVDGNKLSSANPGQRYPANGDLAFWQVKDFRDPIFVNQQVVDSLQDYSAGDSEALKLRVDSYDAKVSLIDEAGQPIESANTWAQQNSLIDASTASITVSDHEGSIRRRIAAPGAGLIPSSIPSSTLGRALELAFGAKREGSSYRIGERVVTADDYEIISDQRTFDLITTQKLSSIWDLQLTADMQLMLQAKEQTADLVGFDRYHATLTPGFAEQDCGQSGCWILIKPKHAPTGPLQASIDGAKVDLVPWPMQPGVYAIHGSQLSQHYPGNMRGRSIVVWDGDTRLGAASLPKLRLHGDIDFGE